MAEKKPQIVIKKITIVQGGGHGGAWKVAFADFMTAMMAFFLVMWLVNSASEAEKKAISDYFSTPSVIEYQFQNFGVQLTLEKLFLDLVNDPLKTLAGFITPADKTPNIMSMGMKKITMAYMTEQLGEVASDVTATADTVVFEIPDVKLFESGRATPSRDFVTVMERIKGVTQGVEDSMISITSAVYRQTVQDSDMNVARNIAEQRLDIISSKIRGSLESESVDVDGRALGMNDDRGRRDKRVQGGYIRVEIRRKSLKAETKKPKTIREEAFEQVEPDKTGYDDIVNQVSKQKSRDSDSKRR